ncbi:GNAT family N-acetyltransferase [Streptomyces sp. NPDC059002]|uniref:GNAT family N-acetyltransferase n=1 Tax=Streptomyces sp. NPDC059002 TaxID=3346690 RepID=UPI0036C9EE8E
MPIRDSDVLIRAMADADCAAVAELRVLGWQSAYAGLMPRSFLDALSVDEVTARLRERLARASGRPARGGARRVDLVAERAGRTVGWTSFGPARDPDVPPGEAELYALYVHPEQHSTGVGRALLRECLRRCTAAGHSRLRLWVLGVNTRARRFCECAGFVRDGALDPRTAGDRSVPEIRYHRDLT